MGLIDQLDEKAIAAEVRRVRSNILRSLAVPEVGNGNLMQPDAAIIALVEVLVMVSLTGVSTNRAKVRDMLSLMLDKVLDDYTSDEAMARLKEAVKKYPGPDIAEQREYARKMGMLK